MSLFGTIHANSSKLRLRGRISWAENKLIDARRRDAAPPGDGKARRRGEKVCMELHSPGPAWKSLATG